jgi:hypothetical protein
MDRLTASQKNSIGIPVRIREEKTSNDNLTGECRNLISLVSQKIETLCHECCEDPDQVKHIRSLTASLTTLSSLLKTLEQEHLYSRGSDVFEDALGIKYRSIRNCDLERWFSEK